MNSRKWVVILSFVLLVTLLVTGLASAKATRSYFKGTETQTGGEDPLREWSAGQTFHLRDMHNVYLEEVTEGDQRAAGINHTSTNINFHPPSDDGKIGEFWGTYEATSHDGSGYWMGTFQGSMYADYSVHYKAHGNGGGDYAGLKIFIESDGNTFWGTILDPGG